MNGKRRWLQSAIREARSESVKMPWARGPGRNGWKARVAQRAAGKARKSA